MLSSHNVLHLSLHRTVSILLKEQFKDTMDGLFEHLATGGGKVSPPTPDLHMSHLIPDIDL